MNDRLSLFRPPLPTPVKVSNLKLLLDGYELHLVDNLMFGFSFGFHIHFQGLNNHLKPAICDQLWTILKAVFQSSHEAPRSSLRVLASN
jgi:hypothetical protein